MSQYDDEQSIIDEGLLLQEFPPLERDLDYIVNHYLAYPGAVLIGQPNEVVVDAQSGSAVAVDLAANGVFHVLPDAELFVGNSLVVEATFDIASQSTAGVAVDALHESVIEIATAATAAVRVDASSTSTFEIGSASFTRNEFYTYGNIWNIPVWPFAANWTGEVRQVFEWQTDILRSTSGAEQRRGLRKYPRRTLEFDVLAARRERALLDNLIAANGSSDWYLPMWQIAYRSDGIADVGSRFVPLIGADEIIEIGDILFMGTSPFDYEMIEVSGINEDGISIVWPLFRTWADDTPIHPARRARLTDQPTLRRHTDTVVSAPIRFNLLEVGRDVESAVPPATYNGFAVISEPPDETRELEFGFERSLDELDNLSAQPVLVDKAGISFSRQNYAWVLRNGDNYRAFIALSHHLKGRLTPVWIPSFFEDFVVVDDTPAGNAFILVEDVGFHLSGPVPGRNHVVLEMMNGQRHYRQIVASAAGTGGQEIVGLDQPFDADIRADDVARVSFLRLCRLDQDQIELLHSTDTTGVATVSAAFRSTPDLRQIEAGF
jgi:hypothetical protein